MAKKRGKSTGPAVSRQQQKDARKAQRTAERKQRQVAAMAQAAKPIETPKLPWPAPLQPTESRDQYRFLNPYNFVRYLPEPAIPHGDPDALLLGRCPPPPHDRYTGLTGRITCSLEAVTPLFVSDGHDIKVTKVRLPDGREVEHKSYRFFQYDGQDAIPATSLRGMIRSMFEVVTNSPFSIFDGEERPQDGRAGVIALCEEAKVSAYYDDPESNVLDGSWTCGEEAWAIVGKTKNNIPKVEIISRNHAALAGDGRQVHHGWVKVTGHTIDTKRNESLFYFKGDVKRAQMVHFDAEREADFNAVLHAQLHDRKEDFHSQVQSERLAPGNLVYVELDSDRTTVRNIALARVARLRYRRAIGELLPEHLRPCERYEQLDIASRVFGWVKATPTEDRKTPVAYAGRVRFSHAVLTEDGDKGVYAKEMPMAILGAPKPTTTLFYLRKQKDEWSEEERKKPGAAGTIGYDGPNNLRGRKFCRHHGNALNRLEYERAGRLRDHQNRSVRALRAPANVFEFAIDFHNLAPLEIGALLWTLNLSGDEGCLFRLGYAKPLGFGSVKLSVEQIELMDLSARYNSLTESGWRSVTTSERGNWLASFETAMQRSYSESLRALPAIADLMALLTDPRSGQPAHVHYPRIDPKPDPEGKNFEWFVANKVKSTKPEKAGPNLLLELPESERGLPLLKKADKR